MPKLEETLRRFAEVARTEIRQDFRLNSCIASIPRCHLEISAIAFYPCL